MPTTVTCYTVSRDWTRHANTTTEQQITDTSNSQPDASPQDASVNAWTDAEPRPHAPHQADVSALPQQFLKKLTTILQQDRNSTTHSGTPLPDATEDDRLSAASLPVRSNHPLSMQVLPTRSSTQVDPPCSSGVPTLLLTPSLPQPTLPPISARIHKKIARGEYIDFTALFSKSMFGAPESQSQALTLQLSSSGDNYSIQSPTTPANKKITSFAIWMEAWNVYLAVHTSIDPSHTSHLIAYQQIITSANSQHPLHAWLSYDMRFRTKAAC